MRRLLAADFYSLRKSKLALVITIVAIVLPFLMVMLYLGLQALINAVRSEPTQGLPFSFTARSLISGSFSISGDMGLILPIFTGILAGADLVNGTLRNKVIIGHSKTKIYFSHLFTTIVFHLFIAVVYALCTAGFSLIFFKYGVEITSEEIKNIIYFVVTGLLGYVFSATVISAFALFFKNPAPTILITVILCLGIGLIGTLINLLDYESYKYAIYLIPSFANNQFTAFGGISDVVFIEGVISYLLFGGIFVLVGALLFNKHDLQ